MAPAIPPLFFLMRDSAGAVVNPVTTQRRNHERLVEEVKRDLDVFNKALYKVESEMRDREARFELEERAQAYADLLEVRRFPPDPEVRGHKLISCMTTWLC